MFISKLSLSEPLVSIKEAAQILDGVHTYKTLKTYAVKRRLPFPAEKLGARWYARRADVEKYAADFRERAQRLANGSTSNDDAK